MRPALRVTLALVVLAHAGCCFGDFAQGFQEGFNESFCTEYQRSFVDTCTSTCVQTAGEPQRAACASGCQDELTRDPTYSAQCGAAAPTPPATPPPVG